MLVLKITAWFRSQKRIITSMVNELHRSKHGCQRWTELVAKFGCFILLDQFDKKGRETVCPFSSEAEMVMLKSVVCSSVPTSASKSIIPRVHCAFPIAMEMLSSSCKRKARNKKNCI